MTGYRDGYDIHRWYASSRRVPRRRRPIAKWLLSLTLVSTTGWLVASVALSRPGAEADLNLIFVWLPMVLASSTSPFTRDTWLTSRGLGSYDEFERAALTDATRRAYLVFLVVLCAGVLALAAALHWGAAIAMSPALLIKVALGVLAIGVTLPVTIAEWTVPMPDAEDEPL